MKASEALQQAKSLISKPSAWTKHHLSLDGEGKVVKTWHPDACAWCTIGAVVKVCHPVNDPDLVEERAIDFLSLAARNATGFSSVAKYNDDPLRSHEDVLSLFDTAIALAQAKGE